MISIENLVRIIRDFYLDLPEPDKTIFGSYYGYPLEERKTFEQISKEIHLEPSKVFEVYKTAMARLYDKLKE